MSSQTGWPDGASAECGSDIPSASPTTCDVAAVPRNWHPPPGLAQARQPRSAASCRVIVAVGEADADRLDLAGVLALLGREGHAAGDEHAGQVAHRRPAPSSSRAGPCRRSRRRSRPRRAGQRPDQPPEDRRRVVAVRQAVHHPRRPLAPPVARVRAEPRERHAAPLLQLPAPPRGRAGSPPSAPCDTPAPAATRRPPATRRWSKGSRTPSAPRAAGPTPSPRPATARTGPRWPSSAASAPSAANSRTARRPWCGRRKHRAAIRATRRGRWKVRA